MSKIYVFLSYEYCIIFVNYCNTLFLRFLKEGRAGDGKLFLQIGVPLLMF